MSYEKTGMYEYETHDDLGFEYHCKKEYNDQDSCRAYANKKECLNNCFFLTNTNLRPSGCSLVTRGEDKKIVYNKNVNEKNCGLGGYDGEINIIYLKSSVFKDIENNPNKQQEAYKTLLHEIGHFLGLEHPFDRGKGFCKYNPDYNTDHSVMAYCRGTNDVDFFRDADIKAIKQLWTGIDLNNCEEELNKF